MRHTSRLFTLLPVAALAALATAVWAEEIRRTPATPIRIPVPAHPKAEPQVDLRPEIMKLGLAIRDQENRPICSVFATTFLIEYHTARTTGKKDLHFSVEYIHWATDKVAGGDTDFFSAIAAGYKTYGTVPEKDLPFEPNLAPPKLFVTPSEAVIKIGEKAERFPFTFIKPWNHDNGMDEKELQATMAALKAGHPVATGVWWNNDVATKPQSAWIQEVDGVPLIKEYPPKDKGHSPMFDGHSIALVGFREGKEFPGGGYFIFRNSWGPKFCDEGYGFLSFQYIRDYSNDAISIEQKEAK
jgi:hypothetical protein